MKKIHAYSLAVATVLAPLAANAATATTDMEQKAWYMADAPRAGWYLDAAGLASLQNKAKAESSADKVSFDPGWGVSAGGGYALGNGLRLEGELTYRRVNEDKVVSGATDQAGTGHLRNFSLMGNVYYDIATGTRFTPYVGVGVGPSLVDASEMGSVSRGTIDSTEVAFAYQGIAGFSTALDKNWSLTTDYRYFRTLDPTFDTDTAARATMKNASHNFMMGVRYTFGGPAPVEKPAPAIKPIPTIPSPPLPELSKVEAPAVPQSYMVFFDFDRATLTAEAKRIIAAAAHDYKQGKYIRIVVTGHTDTMGTPRYNQKLSERRAAAVRNEFAALGVAPADIQAVGAGETGLLVPTANGVREAQNRRAEILFKQ